MSIDQDRPGTGGATDASAAPDRVRPDPERVFADYVRRTRRQRQVYAGVLMVAGLVIAVGATLVLRHGEAAHATLHQARVAAAAPPIGSVPDAIQSLAWHSADATASGEPAYRGIVVTYSAHTVTGRNYRTGAADWTYTRTDVSVCQVVQEQGTTVAFYDLNGNCDEAAGFNTGTGARVWYRTLDSNGRAVNGHPIYAASANTILMSTPAFVQAIDPADAGLDRWNFAQPSGCTTTSTALGTAGVLIGQQCADGAHLLLRAAYTADDDTGKTQTTLWRLDHTDVRPLSADGLISAYDRATGDLVQYRSTDGHVLSTQPLAPAPADTAPVTAVSSSDNLGEYIWIGGTYRYFDAASATAKWSVPAPGLPSLIGATPVIATVQGVLELDPATGNPATTYLLPDSPVITPGVSTATPIGNGFVLGGASTSVYR